MAQTCVTCGAAGTGCGCNPCMPANVIYRGECQDPGVQTSGRFLSVRDYKFCEGRLANAAGLLVNQQNGSGNFSLGWTTQPKVALDSYQAVANTAFGNIIVGGSDNIWRYLDAPVSAGLFMQTNATGDVIFGPGPAAVVPDPLTVNNLNVTVKTTTADLTVSGDTLLNGVASGTVVSLLGLDVTNKVVTQALAQGVQMAMYFESPTSPSASTPNDNKNNGEYLIIGNRLFLTGTTNILNVATSEQLSVAEAGNYLLIWSLQFKTFATSSNGAWLLINGVVVNYGTGRSGVTAQSGVAAAIYGMEARTLAVNDTIQLQWNTSSSGGTKTKPYEVRLIAVKL